MVRASFLPRMAVKRQQVVIREGGLLALADFGNCGDAARNAGGRMRPPRRPSMRGRLAPVG